MKNVISILCLLLSFLSFSQNQKLDRKAFYFRGEYALQRVLLDSNALLADFIPATSNGLAKIKTEILPDGKIGKTYVVQSIDDRYDKEAVRLVKLLPDWRAAKMNRKLVSSFVVIDVDFKKIGRQKKKEPEQVKIFQVVEETPSYPGGYAAMNKFIKNNLAYPAIAYELGDEGKVYVSFTISEEGKISDVKVVRGVSEELNAEAIRVIKAMPNWIPGKAKGKNVKCTFTIPINFRLG